MADSAEAKGARLQIRCDESAKRKIERAAAHVRKSVSEFVIQTAVERAERVIDESAQLTLSEPDWDLFLAALTDPPEPNKALRRAFQRRARRT